MKRLVILIAFLSSLQQLVFCQITPNQLKEFKTKLKIARNYRSTYADSSLFYALQCIDLAKKSKNDSLLFDSYLTVGNAYSKLFKFSESIDNYLMALKIVENEVGNRKGLALGNIGTLYRNNRKFDEGFLYAKRSYTTAVMANDIELQITQLNNMCDYFNIKNLPDSALKTLYIALSLARKNNLKRQASVVLDNIANVIYSKAELTGNKKLHELVKLYLDSALVIHGEIKDSSGIAYCYGLLGATNWKTGSYQKAEEYYKKSEILTRKMNDIASLMLCYEEMSMLYNEQKKFQQAYFYRVKYDSLYQAHINTTSDQQMEELNKKYKTEQKEKENQLLNAKNNLSTETIKRQKASMISVVIGLIALLAGIIFIYLNLRNQKKANHVISEQKLEVEMQKSIVDHKNKEITDSITYAKRIQTAILPSEDYIAKHVNDLFIYYKPKDIVSGDFYWAAEKNKKLFLVTADCTGHGVPGAMLSTLGINLLNQLVIENNLTDAAEILNTLRRDLIKVTNPEGSKEESKDGMDCTLLIIDKKNRKLEYCNSNNVFYILRDMKIIKSETNRMPVGKSPKELIPFTKNTMDLEENDTIITLTDGFVDQFGGEKGKKYKIKQFEQFIVLHHDKPLSKFKNALEQSFGNWKGDLEQVDDICVIGIRV